MLSAQVDLDKIIGKISPPVDTPGITDTGELTGIIGLINIILRIMFIIAGLYAFFNIIIAGFGFINAGGDPKQVTKAWERIWQSLVGLVIIVTSFLIAAIIGLVLFKDPTAILRPKLTQ